MKSFNFQAPSSREHPTTKSQTPARLRPWRLSLKLGVSLVLGCWGLVLSSHAQYAINWVAFQGGGGESEAQWGTPYYLRSTISQSQGSPPATGGAFTLAGHIFAQNTATVTTAPPTLTLTRNANGTVTVSWPVLSPGYLVQQSTALAPGSWTTAPHSINHNGVIRWFTVQPSAARLFYRLQKA